MIVKPWKILVGCEYSGIVRRALAARGHDVWSVDLLPSLDGSNRHIIGDVRDYLDEGWDFLAVFHPPCTRLCNSGVRWLHEPPGQLGRGARNALAVRRPFEPAIHIEQPSRTVFGAANIELAGSGAQIPAGDSPVRAVPSGHKNHPCNK